MHEHIDPGEFWTLMTALHFASNSAIVAGYFTVPFTALRWLIPWNSPCPSETRFYRFVRIAGVVFFATCGLHHLHAAFSREHELGWGIVGNQIVQAFAVWCFILGFAAVVKRAARYRAAKGDAGGEAY